MGGEGGGCSTGPAVLTATIYVLCSFHMCLPSSAARSTLQRPTTKHHCSGSLWHSRQVFFSRALRFGSVLFSANITERSHNAAAAKMQHTRGAVHAANARAPLCYPPPHPHPHPPRPRVHTPQIPPHHSDPPPLTVMQRLRPHSSLEALCIQSVGVCRCAASPPPPRTHVNARSRLVACWIQPPSFEQQTRGMLQAIICPPTPT